MRKSITELFKNFSSFANIEGNTRKNVDNIQYDSREVTKNSLYCALKGLHVDGHNYIDHAITHGATAILCSLQYMPSESQLKKVAFFRVPENRVKNTMARVSMLFYDYPSNKLKIIGVTGTDGKSSTCSFIHQMLIMLGEKAGLLSTVEFKIGNMSIPNKFRQSTPEAPQIHKILYDMVGAGCEYAIIESTSHGLSLATSRLAEIQFDVGILTNIDQEHLEFHLTIENYVNAKANLFHQIKSLGQAVIRYEEKYYKTFEYATFKNGAHIVTYSTKCPEAKLFLKNINISLQQVTGTLVCKSHRLRDEEEYPFLIHCTGIHNAENALAALSTLQFFGYEYADIVKILPRITLPKGRMEIVRSDLNILPIVDYAHTPGSFETLFSQIKRLTKGRLILVFGSAGERDILKRKLQGQIADKYGDIIILTNEDSRLESPEKIVKDIAEGCKNHTLHKNLYFILDRKAAIHKALELSQAQDTILFLGKGHEKTIEHADHVQTWNETQVVNDLITKMLPFKDW